MHEPFSPVSPYTSSPDQRTRVIFFALNLTLQPGEDLSVVTADAEDASHQHYNLKVEYVGPVPLQEWMSAVVLRLNDDLKEVGDVLVRVAYHGVNSNRVRIGIGHLGGGPVDDARSVPTPAPPYIISGQIKSGSQGVSDVSVKLSGTQTETVLTNESGFYSFTVKAVGDYSITPSKIYYNFGPTSQSFSNLSSPQTNVNFTASRQTYTISGVVQDDHNQGLDRIEVTLADENGTMLKSTVTNGGGRFSFADMPAGFVYTVRPANNSFFTFTGQSTNTLSGNLALSFTATRRTYMISGRVLNSTGSGVGDVTLSLSGSQTATQTTDGNGNYSFAGLAAGGNYTITLSPTAFYNFTAQSINNLASNQEANFTGTLRTYTLSGRVTSGANALSGVTVVLSGSQSATTTTDASGNYSFANVTATGNYTLTPSRTNYNFTPSSQNFNNVAGSQTANFTGALNQYTIRGRIIDGQHSGLANATLVLSGSQAGTVQTDVAGNYSFTVLAEGNYTITPSKQHYLFNPHEQSFNNLAGNQEADFNGALLQYTISGRVTDSSGQGLFGITLSLSGSQTATTKTASDGSYALSATALGNYVITPSIEQDYYSFGPRSQSISGLSGSQTLNFTAQLAPFSDPSYVLEFDGSPKTVDYSTFWPGPGVNLGHFFWEFWAMPGDNAGATYLLSDGYGGAHALLFGFGSYGSSEQGRYQLFGDIFDGVPDASHITFFSSDQGPAVGEWGHFAVGWDGQNIITYFNGVPVGKTAFAGLRQSPGFAEGGGRLLIGGSDHNNLVGRIAQVRGFEGSNPRETTGPGESTVEASFTPQTVFGAGGNLLNYYFRPAQKIADLSRGQEGNIHVGTPRGTTAGVLADCGSCPPPQFVTAPNAPNFVSGKPQQPVLASSPPAAPPGALVFDSFSRANSTYIFNGTGGLSATEGGAAGTKTWQTSLSTSGLKPFGLLNGLAVMLANDTHVTWVQTGSATGNLDIRVDRHAGRWGSGLDTGLSFRVTNASNYFFAYTSESSQSPSTRTLTVGYYLNGQRTNLVMGLNMPANWTTLRVVTTNTGSINVYADADATPVYSVNSNLMTTASGAGLYNNSSGLGLVNRWDNFTVYDAP